MLLCVCRQLHRCTPNVLTKLVTRAQDGRPCHRLRLFQHPAQPTGWPGQRLKGGSHLKPKTHRRRGVGGGDVFQVGLVRPGRDRGCHGPHDRAAKQGRLVDGGVHTQSCDFTAHMCTGSILSIYVLFVNPLFKLISIEHVIIGSKTQWKIM